jgi:phosphoglycerate dehydrogenase-like enzyme
MLLIGVGAIGAHTAKLATALGLRVEGIRRYPEHIVEGISAMFGPDSLTDRLPHADFVVITAPLTPETRGMIDERALRLMKSSAYLVNIGRGATVQTAALIKALQAGWIAGAGLDVIDPEPLPSDSPLWTMENVIITAHYAGYTPVYTDRAKAIFLDNLQRYLTGQRLHNVVDKRLGY